MAGMSGEVVRVVVVDDDPLVRAGLTLMVGGSQGVEVVAEAADGLEALEVVPRHEPDVVLMDIRMPRMDGIAATQALLARPRPPRVLVLTTFDADELVLRALQVGAAGFLLKDTRPDALVAAIHSVARGEPTLSPTVTAQLIAAVTDGEGQGPVRDRAREQLGRLTERELDVARAVARGLSNTEISQQLYLSVPTVKSHVGRIFTKLDVENRVQVALVVRDAGDDRV